MPYRAADMMGMLSSGNDVACVQLGVERTGGSGKSRRLAD